MPGKDVHLVVIKRWQAILVVAVILLAIFSGSYNTIQGWQADQTLERVQERMQNDQERLEKRRFQAEMRTCRVDQTIVRNERKVIKRSVQAQRAAGLLTRERLNFARVVLKDLKIPKCTPTLVGFPQFEPENLLP